MGRHSSLQKMGEKKGRPRTIAAGIMGKEFLMVVNMRRVEHV